MVNSKRTLILITTLLGVVPSTLAQATLTDKVVKFCKDHRGEKVGKGECSDLADAALKEAEAKPRTKFKEVPSEGDYVWGQLVYALEVKDGSLKETKVPGKSIQPGDVIQFRDTTFKGKNLRGFEVYDAAYPHHTAVVVALWEEKHVVTVLEQNFNGQLFVTESPYRLSDLKTGWVRVYRPVSE